MLRNWRTFDGWVLAHGVRDPMKLPISRFCNLVWFWMTDGADPNEIRKVEAQLWAPPLGEEAKGVWSPEAEMEAFNALKASLGQ